MTIFSITDLFLSKSFGKLMYNSDINKSSKILECVIKCNLTIKKNENKNYAYQQILSQCCDVEFVTA